MKLPSQSWKSWKCVQAHDFLRNARFHAKHLWYIWISCVITHAYQNSCIHAQVSIARTCTQITSHACERNLSDFAVEDAWSAQSFSPCKSLHAKSSQVHAKISTREYTQILNLHWHAWCRTLKKTCVYTQVNETCENVHATTMPLHAKCILFLANMLSHAKMI